MMTGEQTPSLRVARSCVFSPVSPHFRETTGRQQNSLTLILFSPRKPRFRRRCAPLKVSLWRRMSADATGSLILTKRQHPRCAERLLECFLFVLLFRSQGAFSRGENEFIIKSEICCLEKKRIFCEAEKALFWRKSEFFTELKKR